MRERIQELPQGNATGDQGEGGEPYGRHDAAKDCEEAGGLPGRGIGNPFRCMIEWAAANSPDRKIYFSIPTRLRMRAPFADLVEFSKADPQLSS